VVLARTASDSVATVSRKAAPTVGVVQRLRTGGNINRREDERDHEQAGPDRVVAPVDEACTQHGRPRHRRQGARRRHHVAALRELRGEQRHQRQPR
jgi:hypothetical protein